MPFFEPNDCRSSNWGPEPVPSDRLWFLASSKPRVLPAALFMSIEFFFKSIFSYYALAVFLKLSGLPEVLADLIL